MAVSSSISVPKSWFYGLLAYGLMATPAIIWKFSTMEARIEQLRVEADAQKDVLQRLTRIETTVEFIAKRLEPKE
jgi:hypothetical protein